MSNLSLLDLGWLLYRRLRIAGFTICRKNPLAQGPNGIPWEVDLRTVKALSAIRSDPPGPLREDAAHRICWKTHLGEFWTPPGSTAYYVRLIETEALADVYNLRGANLSGATFFDCGANVGFITRMALAHSAAQVIAFEPSPQTAQCLRMNFSSEIAAGKVTVIEKALWNAEDILWLNTAQVSNPASHSLVESGESPRGVRVPVTTIDRVVADLNLARVDFIKMDIEGAEANALAGAAATIRRFRPSIALGTEHTQDLLANNEAVIRQIRSLVPEYEYFCTEVHPHRSPTRGWILAPHSICFAAAPRP